jgi:hypothetical protein
MESTNTEQQILRALELLHRDAVVAVGEEYLPLGRIAHEAAAHIRFLRERINELESWRYGS